MSRFETIQRGKRERKIHDFPMPLDAAEGAPRVTVALVVLSGDEEAAAIAAGRAFAKSKGSENPQQGDPQFDLGVMVHKLVRACLDPDVPGSFCYFFAGEGVGDRPTPEQFDAMARTMLEHMDRERIAYLHTLYEVWQDYCSPWGPHVDEATILTKLTELEKVTDPAVPFEMFRPATLGSCFLTTVRQRAILLRDRLGPGLSFESASPTSTKSDPPS